MKSQPSFIDIGVNLTHDQLLNNLDKVINWMLIDDEYVKDINNLSFFPVGSKIVFESSGELLIWGDAREIIIKSFDDESLKKEDIKTEFIQKDTAPSFNVKTLHLSTIDYDKVPYDAYYIGKGDIVTIYNLEKEKKIWFIHRVLLYLY